MNKRAVGSATLMAMMLGMTVPLHYGRPFNEKPPEDEIDRYLRLNKTTLQEEFEKIKARRSGLSVRQRNIVIYRVESAQE